MNKKDMTVEERYPFWEFHEKGLKANIHLTCIGLKTSRKAGKLFKPYPNNGKVVKEQFNDTSFEYAIQVKPNKDNARIQQFRFAVNELPCSIDPTKTKITYNGDKIHIQLEKKEGLSWMPYVENDLEKKSAEEDEMY